MEDRPKDRDRPLNAFQAGGSRGGFRSGGLGRSLDRAVSESVRAVGGTSASAVANAWKGKSLI